VLDHRRDPPGRDRSARGADLSASDSGADASFHGFTGSRGTALTLRTFLPGPSDHRGGQPPALTPLLHCPLPQSASLKAPRRSPSPARFIAYRFNSIRSSQDWANIPRA
jgi:hypothetical protein